MFGQNSTDFAWPRLCHSVELVYTAKIKVLNVFVPNPHKSPKKLNLKTVENTPSSTVT